MEIERIVLATDDMSSMVTFYNAVFDSGLEPVAELDSFHVGSFAGTPLLLCPNSIAEVDARQNRHQFRIAVADVDELVRAAENAGGRVLGDDRHDGRRLVGLRDPDGNTYEIVDAGGSSVS